LGQPLAQNSEFYWFGSGESQLFLDYSGLEITPPPTSWSSQIFHGRQPSDGIFRPHVLIEYTIYHWINNNDPFFDFVVEEISK
ncbi:MAG: YcfL family protein, partial [Defluviitaleaceae bacterium]|nr:YcfL family protein [Defluviitaleaceae bacterium]